MGRQHRLFFATAAGSLLSIYAVYLTELFQYGEAHMVWLLAVTLVSAVLLHRSMEPAGERPGRIWTVLLVLSAAVGSAYGIWLSALAGYPFLLQLSGWLAVALAAVSLCAMAADGRRKGYVLDVATILFGFLLAGLTVRLLYDYYLFSEEGRGAVWLLGIPVTVFSGITGIQVLSAGSRHRYLRIGFSCVQILLPFVLYFLWRFITAGEGWV